MNIKNYKIKENYGLLFFDSFRAFFERKVVSDSHNESQFTTPFRRKVENHYMNIFGKIARSEDTYQSTDDIVEKFNARYNILFHDFKNKVNQNSPMGVDEKSVECIEICDVIINRLNNGISTLKDVYFSDNSILRNIVGIINMRIEKYDSWLIKFMSKKEYKMKMVDFADKTKEYDKKDRKIKEYEERINQFEVKKQEIEELRDNHHNLARR